MGTSPEKSEILGDNSARICDKNCPWLVTVGICS